MIEVPLLPGLLPFAEMGDVPLDDRSPTEARAALHEMIALGVSMLSDLVPPAPVERDVCMAVPGGEIVLRSYAPENAVGLPGYVYFHGGGWWSGTLDLSDNTCRMIARDAACVVVSVGYRLAPEHPFPVPFEDCYSAVCWTIEHATELGIDPRRVAIGGESAGGNLAAAVALALRDRGGPTVVLQVLEIPATDLTMSQPSVQENDAGPVLTAAELGRCISMYLGNRGSVHDPYASPVFASSHAGLPPALVMTAEYDPLRDDGEHYARCLEAASVQVELVRWEGQFHGCSTMAKLIPEEAAAYHHRRVRALRSAFDQGL